MSSADAIARFRDSDWTGGVVGLGYVGLQVAVAIVDAGLTCIGYDVRAPLIRRLTNGHAHVDDVSDRDLKRALDNGLTLTDEWSALIGVDALFICVPSPVPKPDAVDETHLEAVARLIRRVVRRGMLIAVETTVYPGATERIILAAAQEGGCRIDRDVFVAVCPERVNPGSGLRLVEIPRVVGGVTRVSGEVAAAAYARFVNKVHTLSSARAAEMTKLVENGYRAVNIGYVNEVARLANSLSIDIWEVIQGAETKPFGYHSFHPGPGTGGHCVPLSLRLLASPFGSGDFRQTSGTPLLDAALETDRRMPSYIADRAESLLLERGLVLSGAHVLGVGAAYKPDVTRTVGSAALRVVEEMDRRGAIVSIMDPLVNAEEIAGLKHDIVDAGDDLTAFDLAIILTDHDFLDLARICERVPAVLDTRDAYRRRGLRFSNVTTI